MNNLEAEWAAFFEAGGIKVRYTTKNRSEYKFFLPNLKTYVAIKEN